MGDIIIASARAVEQFRTLTVKIVSPETEEEARKHLTNLRLARKNLEADVKNAKAPHQAEIKKIDEAARPLKALLDEKDREYEQAILAYQRAVREATDKANQKALDKYEKDVAKKEAQAIAAGRPLPVVLPPVVATAPPKTIETDGARQTTVKRKAWRLRLAGSEVADPSVITAQVAQNFKSELPLEFFVLDTARIGKIVRAGGTVPGIEVYEEESIAVKA